ncbi:MAG: anthranilate synthase component I family protein [Deltaproteobacteria bacterium]|nr:anthranilate synthase component I family protein [Deltaproteobacteria bacterium]
MTIYQEIQAGPVRLVQGRADIPYRGCATVFGAIFTDYDRKVLLESKDISHIYGRMSLIGVDPVLEIMGKDDNFSIRSFNDRGRIFLNALDQADFNWVDEIYLAPEGHLVQGVVHREAVCIEERERSKQKNIAQVVRLVLEKFQTELNGPLGLYGAFSYDFVRLFEDIGDSLPAGPTPDFRLSLYDTFILFDHLKEKAEIVCFRSSQTKAGEAIDRLAEETQRPVGQMDRAGIKDAGFLLSRQEYEDLVTQARKYIMEGEIFEVVFANSLTARFDGHPYDLYLRYSAANPSPYLFYLDYGDEQLVGASPEMMIRCEGGIVHIRPISGTKPRGRDPIEDHDNMLELLNSPKEKAELDMLVDLARNDLSRVCQPGVEISDYRFVEKYSRVMHTVTHVSGRLRDGLTAFDALVSTLNNGTLTGAPKVAAMQIIERHEKIRRGYYGGAVGYLTLHGDLDTGIIIRTAHIKDHRLTFQAGASLVYDSIPAEEYQETLNKAAAFMSLLEADVG